MTVLMVLLNIVTPRTATESGTYENKCGYKKELIECGNPKVYML